MAAGSAKVRGPGGLLPQPGRPQPARLQRLRQATTPSPTRSTHTPAAATPRASCRRCPPMPEPKPGKRPKPIRFPEDRLIEAYFAKHPEVSGLELHCEAFFLSIYPVVLALLCALGCAATPPYVRTYVSSTQA